MAIEVGTAYISILPSTSKLASGITGELRKAESTAKVSGSRAGSQWASNFKSKLGSVVKGGLFAGLAGGSLLLGAGIKTAAELEQASLGFETMLGSAEKADKFMDKIKSKAAKTPFELAGLTKASQKLLAFGFDVDRVLPTLTTLGDAASGLGAGQQGLDQIINAVGQIQAKGKLQGDELLQLTEVGIPAARILQNELGLSADEFAKMQAEGKLTANKVIPALLDGMKNGTKGVAGQTAAFGGLMAKQANSLGGLWETLKDTVLVGVASALEPLIPLLKQGLAGAVKYLEPAMAKFGEALAKTIEYGVDFAKSLAPIFGWLRDNKEAVFGFAGTLLAIAAAVKVWAIAQGILNAVLYASPLTWIALGLAALVAGLVLAYKESETFREIVQKVWDAIRVAVDVAWNKVIKPALSAWMKYFTDVLFPTLKFFWSSIAKPVFQKVGGAVKATWEKAIRPALKAFSGFLTKAVFPTIRFLWDKVVKPVFKYVSTEIKQFWTGIGKPIFSAWKTYFQRVLFPVIRFLWDKVVKPVFGGVKKTISTVWSSGIKPVFDRMKDGVEAVASAFKTAKDAIKKAWDKVEGIIKPPIRFVIDRVYNNGIRKVLDFLSFLPGIEPPPEIKGWATGGYTGPGGKYTPAGIVHAGEYVIRKESTAKLQQAAPGLLDSLNRSGRLPGYWTGGGVYPIPGYPVTNPHGVPYYGAWWAGDMAAPQGTPIRAWKAGRVAEVSHNADSYGNETVINHDDGNWTRYAHQLNQLVRVGQMVRAGQVIGYSGATGNVTGPHLHFEIGGGTAAVVSEVGEAISGWGGGPGWNPIERIKQLKEKIDNVRGVLSKLNQNSFARSFKDGFGDIVGSLKDWGINKIKSAASKFFELPNDGPRINGPVQDIVAGVAQRYGWSSGAQWQALTNLINAESTWDPEAQNPDSTAYGLFQFLDSTWATVGGHKTSDPYLQAVYGLKYIKGKYGDPVGAWSYWREHGSYDQGGVLEPGHVAVNLSRKPEAVFNHRQFKEFAREAGGGGRFPNRVTLVVRDREFDAYIREKADDAINGDRAYQGAIRRMRY